MLPGMSVLIVVVVPSVVNVISVLELLAVGLDLAELELTSASVVEVEL